ncbi:MAG: hypothetical protein JNN18_20125 [Rubrivivax sp.]|nr:hypothetical protein [Rubrivivax sp.]
MRLFLYGSRSYAQTLTGIAADLGHEVAGLIDDQHAGPGIVGSFDAVTREQAHGGAGLVLAIGYSDLGARARAWERVRATAWPLPTLVHPRAYVALSATLGPGCVVMAGAIVDQRAQLGEAVVVWPGACVNHDCAIGDNSFISPSAVLCGGATVGPHSFVGAGALIVDGARLPASSFVRMGERVIARGA